MGLIKVILIPAAGWILITVAGWIGLGWLRREMRDALLPIAPLAGVSLAVIVLHNTTFFASVKVGVYFLAAVLLFLIGLNFARDRTWWRPSWSGVGWLVAGGAVGVVGAVVVLLPSLRLRDPQVVQGTYNNDAFYYTVLNDWLQNHPGVDIPTFGTAPGGTGYAPNYAAVATHLQLHLRIGEELVQSALNTVMSTRTTTTWYGFTALWVLLIPAGFLGAAWCLRMRPVVGLVGGLITATATLTVHQAFNQNSASLLGIALAPLAIGLVLRALDSRAGTAELILAAAGLTALIGCYAEFTPLMLPAFVIAVLCRSPRAVPRAVVRGFIVLAVSMLIAPLVWMNAYRSLVKVSGMGDSGAFGSPFWPATRWQILDRFTGTSALVDGGTADPLTVVILFTLLIGFAAAVCLSQRRLFVIVLVATGLALAYVLGPVRHAAYSQQRSVQIWLPLVVLCVAFGFDRLITAVGLRRARTPAVEDTPLPEMAEPERSWRGRRSQVAVVAVAACLAITWLGSNLYTNHEQLPSRQLAAARHVDSTFNQAASWIRELDGPDGANTMVLSGEVFTQLWITEILRPESLVSYPSLYLSYQIRPSYWDGQVRRYLLIDQAVFLDADSGMIVRQNSRFRLLDLSRGQMISAVSTDEFGNGHYFFLKTNGVADAVRLSGTTDTKPRSSPLTFAQLPATPLPPGSLSPTTTEVTAPLQPGPSTILDLTDGHYYLNLTGISRVPSS